MSIAHQVSPSCKDFWGESETLLLQSLETNREGLTTADANSRLFISQQKYAKEVHFFGDWQHSAASLFIFQFKSPIILILIAAAILSLLLKDHADALIILIIVVISGGLGFSQEYRAANAVAKLLELVRTKVKALRDGATVEIFQEGLVIGDIVLLSAGDKVPADCRILTSKDLFIDEAILTGESFPIEKSPGNIEVESLINQRTNSLFMGTHVVSGSATAVVACLGNSTEFGRIAATLKLRPPETEFERGIRQFGYLLAQMTILLVLAIFAINVYFDKPVLESLLFSLALAVGLTPQLLPAIISVNLAHGATRMAKHRVIVKRLSSIENFGSMDVLCTDKTGTITTGEIEVDSTLDALGNYSEKARLYSFLNAMLQSGYSNPIDQAIVKYGAEVTHPWQKLDEVPYDFIRKRLSILVSNEGRSVLITKGSVSNILDVCTRLEDASGNMSPSDGLREKALQLQERLGKQGFRSVAVAYKAMAESTTIKKPDEAEMIFIGLLVLRDPPRKEVPQTLKHLRKLGIITKLVTGDNRHVATQIAIEAGFDTTRVITGHELVQMTNETLMHLAPTIEVFAEVEPQHKERIILALKKTGHVVGYIGDGVNDTSALHAADIGISVNNAVDVAKEAADIILLEKNLNILASGVIEGRRTFSNTLKYIFMATSANFGNMFSMAGVSLLLPFLPLFPQQILFVNLLTDLPEMTISTDRVDRELLQKPRPWDIGFIKRFMLLFGLLSSIFDYCTFALLHWLSATPTLFRTGWFVESVVSASMIVLVIRTPGRFLKSRPSTHLILATGCVVALATFIPYTPIAKTLGFCPLPLSYLTPIFGITILYLLSAEFAKLAFYRWAANKS